MLRSGAVTSMALTEHALERIKSIDPLISSFITLTQESALADAAAADADFAKGIDKGPMQGIPHALKDIYGDGRHPHDLPFEAARRQRSEGGFGRRGEIQGAGRGAARQARDA